jgi:hypothetical protein
VLGTAAAGAASQTLALTAAILPAAGAVGLLPAVAVSAAGALGVLKLATSGLKKVMKAVAAEDATKFQEALKELSPQARLLAVELRNLRPAFERLRDSVQDAVFRRLNVEVRQLAATWLPILQVRLSEIGMAWNVAFRNGLQAARSAVVVQGLTAALRAAHVGVAQLGDAVGPLVRGFGALAGAGVPFIANFGRGLATVTARFGAFLQQAAASGQLTSFFQLVTQTLEDLGGIALQVGGILHGVFSAAASVGGGLLNNLREALYTVNQFLRSAEGQTALRDFFASTSGVLRALLPTLRILAAAFGSTLAPAIAQVAAVLAPVLQVLAGGLVQVVSALAPVLPSLADSLGRIVVALVPLLPPLAQLTAALVTALLPVVNALVPAIATLATVLTPVIGLLAKLSPVIVGIALVIGALLLPAWVLVGVAILGLVTLVVRNWDTIRRVTVGAWNAVRDFVVGAARGVLDWLRSNWPLLVAILAGPVGLAVLAIVRNWDRIRQAGATAVNALLGAWRSVLSFFTGLPGFFGRILAAVGSFLAQLPARAAFAAGFLVGRFLRLAIELPGMIQRMTVAGLLAFGRLVTGMITGGARLAVRVGAAVASFAARLPGIIARGTVAAAAVFGRWVSSMVGRAVSFGARAGAAIASFTARLPGMIVRGTASALGAFGRWASQMVAAGGRLGSGVLRAIGRGIAGIPGLVSGIAGKVLAAFEGVARRAFDAARNLAQNLWNGFKSGLFGSPKTKIEYALLDMNAAVLRELGIFGRRTADLSSLSNFASKPLAVAASAPGGGTAGHLAYTGGGAASVSGAAAAGAGGPIVFEVRSGGSRMDDLLVEIISGAIRTRPAFATVVRKA